MGHNDFVINNISVHNICTEDWKSHIVAIDEFGMNAARVHVLQNYEF